MTKFKNITSKILAGFFDAVLPNIKDSVKLKDSQFIQEKPTYQIDYIRLFVSLSTFGFMVAHLFGFITDQQLKQAFDYFFGE
jgi:hypothetical protein